MGDAFGPRPCASRRASLRCLALSAAVAIAGCAPAASEEVILNSSEVTLIYQGSGVAILQDKRTTCEYIVYTWHGGIINRADPHGRVTPNCPETGGKYGTKLPGDLEAAQ